MGKRIEMRCTGKRPDGTVCNFKLCEKDDKGQFVSKFRKDYQAVIILGSLTCPRCGRIQSIPPSPVMDQPKFVELKNV